MRISLYRYDPDADAAPRMENLELDIPGVGDLMVLDLLERLKAIDPPSLTAAPAAKACAVRTAST